MVEENGASNSITIKQIHLLLGLYHCIRHMCGSRTKKTHTDLLICALRLVLSLIGECLSKNICYISVGIFVSFA